MHLTCHSDHDAQVQSSAGLSLHLSLPSVSTFRQVAASTGKHTAKTPGVRTLFCQLRSILILCPFDALCAQEEGEGAGGLLMDAEWCTLSEAAAVVLDMDTADAPADAPTGAVAGRTPRERAVVAVGAALARSGLRAQLYHQWMQGTQVGPSSAPVREQDGGGTFAHISAEH